MTGHSGLSATSRSLIGVASHRKTLLSSISSRINSMLTTDPHDISIIVPYFTHAHRQASKQITILAGNQSSHLFEDEQIFNIPT